MTDRHTLGNPGSLTVVRPLGAHGLAREGLGVGSLTGLGRRTPRLARVADSRAAIAINPIEA